MVRRSERWMGLVLICVWATTYYLVVAFSSAQHKSESCVPSLAIDSTHFEGLF